MPSRVLCSATAVTRTCVSPKPISAAPSACLAIRPPSMNSGRPWNSISTLRYMSYLPGRCGPSSRGFAPVALQWEGKTLLGMVLLPDPQPVDQTLVAIEFLTLQVVQQPPPLPDELEQPAPGMVVLLMDFEVFGQVI